MEPFQIAASQLQPYNYETKVKPRHCSS